MSNHDTLSNEVNTSIREGDIPADQSITNDLLAQKLLRYPRKYVNLAEDVIVITEDRVRLCLIAHLRRVEARKEWRTPTSILLTIVTTFATTTFRSFLVSDDTWKAMFVIVAIIAGIWLVRAVIIAARSPSVDDIVANMKRESARTPG